MYCSRGLETVSIHARILTGFAGVIATLYPLELIETYQNFMGYGEPFGFLEGNLKDVKWLHK
jgi:hypothetical protein